jgi:hypothetical protein
MSYEIIVRPEAAREVQEAFDWYEEKSGDLGLSFCARQTLAWRASREIRSHLQPCIKTSAGHY